MYLNGVGYRFSPLYRPIGSSPVYFIAVIFIRAHVACW